MLYLPFANILSSLESLYRSQEQVTPNFIWIQDLLPHSPLFSLQVITVQKIERNSWLTRHYTRLFVALHVFTSRQRGGLLLNSCCSNRYWFWLDQVIQLLITSTTAQYVIQGVNLLQWIKCHCCSVAVKKFFHHIK